MKMIISTANLQLKPNLRLNLRTNLY